ncbi:hypothetical protein ASD42_01735 [Nocardia sp. Root136]|uniref:DedA family protein n=1 Tax=Nocardia sp. Root136 TaxID=1736458 RepID=UPI0006F301F7|nr:VTT domain-containing protein [Nocardia sp. Root136]KQY37353.1 hypothetical protein ASD42_01735 [Nocardia sp. Root136]
MDGFASEYLLRFGYWVIFGALAAESTLIAGLVIPGVAVLVLAGFLAGIGELSIGLVLFSAAAGVLVGDNGGYLLGRHGVTRIPMVQKILQNRSTHADSIREGIRWRYVFFQFPMPLRVALPIVAGAVSLSFRRWIVLDLLATAIFVTVVGGIGCGIGIATGRVGQADVVSSYLNYAFAVLFVVWVSVFGMKALKVWKSGR